MWWRAAEANPSEGAEDAARFEREASSLVTVGLDWRLGRGTQFGSWRPGNIHVMFLAPGTVIDGKFEIRSVIGYGGMGVVYEACQRGLDRLVALKMLTNVQTTALH